MLFNIKYILISLSCIFIFSCNTKDEDEYNKFSDAFKDQQEKIQTVEFRGRLDDFKAESFDLKVKTPGEYLFDIKTPIQGIKLLVVDKTTMHIVDKISNNQTINLKEGNYNLVVTNHMKNFEPTEVIFEVVKN